MPLKQLLLLKPLLADFIRFSPGKVTSVLALMLLSSFTSGLGILFILPLLNAIGIEQMGGQSSSGFTATIFEAADQLGLSVNLANVLGFYLVLIISVNLISYYNTLASTALNKCYTTRLRNTLYQHILYAQWRYLTTQSMTDYIRLVSGQVQSVSNNCQQILNIINSLILISVYATLSFLLSPWLTLLALSLGLLLMLILIPLNSFIQRSGTRQLRANKQMFRAIVEELNNLKIIKVFGSEKQYLQRMQQTGEILEQQQLKITQYNAISRLVNAIGAAVAFTLLFYTALGKLHLAIGNIVLLLYIFSRLLPQISRIQTSLQQLLHAAPAFNDIQSQMRGLAKHQESTISNPVPLLEQHINLEKLSFSYSNASHPVFDNLDITIAANTNVAITGPSGIGKSTLVDIISGIIVPTKGHVRVDNTIINDENRVSWRQQIAYVTQDTLLFNGTVRDNLSWVCAQTPREEEIWHALTQASASSFIKKMSMGLDSIIGDNGTKLSGGERQRLTIARALMTKPRVLILDEATSALDKASSDNILKVLKSLEGQLTIIVIAHNEDTIEHISHRIDLTQYGSSQ